MRSHRHRYSAAAALPGTPYKSADFGRRDELVHTRENNTAHEQKHLVVDSKPSKAAAGGISKQVLPVLLRHGS